jgi:Kdo2-lipid IVA lauroyltransferase/acyltransferase
MPFLFRLLSALPLIVLHAVGWLVGWLAYALSPGYRREFQKNARLAGVSARARRRAVAESGKLVAELPRLWMGRLPRIHWHGAEVIEAAVAAHRGVLFLTPHMGSFEATALAYAQRFGVPSQPLTVLFRVPRKAWLRDLVAQARRRPGLDTAPANLAGVRQLLRTLRAGGSVGLLPDQVPPQQLGVWAPFFGQQAYTMTLSVRLAQQTGAEVVLAWGERLSWGRGFVVHVAPLNLALDANMDKAAAQINQAMERLILCKPEQYLWGYSRYKAPRDSL